MYSPWPLLYLCPIFCAKAPRQRCARKFERVRTLFFFFHFSKIRSTVAPNNAHSLQVSKRKWNSKHCLFFLFVFHSFVLYIWKLNKSSFARLNFLLLERVIYIDFYVSLIAGRYTCKEKILERKQWPIFQRKTTIEKQRSILNKLGITIIFSFIVYFF